MMLRVPQAVSASSRSSGYPDPPWLPGCLAKRARLAGVSGTLMVVPSIAHTSSPYQRTPVVAPTAAAPRSRSNSQRSGLALRRRLACDNAPTLGEATGMPARPAVSLRHTSWVSSPRWPGASTPEATLIVVVMVSTAAEGAEWDGNGAPG